MTKEQFMNQNAFWQDKYYSYAIHITDAGAKYLFQVEGTRLTKRELEDFKVGLKVPGKLMPKRIRGGVLLVETNYEMR